MRNVKLLIPAFALAAFSSLPLAAQQQPGQPAPDMPQPSTTQPSSQPGTPQQPGTQPEQTTPSQQGSAAPSTANSPEANNAELRPVTGELVTKLDTKNAKNGDQVVVKTTEKATFADGVEIPKGSKIMGHVTDVQAHDETNPNSKVAIQFDQAELKGGQTVPIKSVLQAIAPATGSDSAQSSPFATGSAPNSAPGSSAPSAPASPTGSASGSANSSGQAPTQGSSPQAQASPGASAAPNGYPPEGTVVAHQGNIEIKTTAIPGVLIASNASGQPFSNASGALLGARQNVHLDNGTKVTLAISNGNAKASNNR